MQIVHFASECAPFTGETPLGDHLKNLLQEQEKQGHSPVVFLPLYQTVCQLQASGAFALDELEDKFKIHLGQKIEPGTLLKGTLPGTKIPAYFIDNPVYFLREGLYSTEESDYADNSERFIFFVRSALKVLEKLNLTPDILHCHDWQTALAPVYIKAHYREIFPDLKCVMSIHNLAYQGLFIHFDIEKTGLGWDYFNHHRLEFYGKLNFLKGGIVFADAVSLPMGASIASVQVPGEGCGLEKLFEEEKEKLHENFISPGTSPKETAEKFIKLYKQLKAHPH